MRDKLVLVGLSHHHDLTQYLVNASRPATKIILTGPNLITQENAGHVLALSQEGLR